MDITPLDPTIPSTYNSYTGGLLTLITLIKNRTMDIRNTKAAKSQMRSIHKATPQQNSLPTRFPSQHRNKTK